MTPDEAFFVTMMAMVEAMADTVCQKSRPKSYRWNQAMGLKEKAHQVNESIQGTFPDKFIHKAEKFYKMVETDINWLLKGYKDEH